MQECSIIINQHSFQEYTFNGTKISFFINSIFYCKSRNMYKEYQCNIRSTVFKVLHILGPTWYLTQTKILHEHFTRIKIQIIYEVQRYFVKKNYLKNKNVKTILCEIFHIIKLYRQLFWWGFFSVTNLHVFWDFIS